MHRFLAIALMLNGCTHFPTHEAQEGTVLVRLETGVMEAAAVKALLPNGDLALVGPTVSGVVRPIDIAIDGSVRSAYVTSK